MLLPGHFAQDLQSAFNVLPFVHDECVEAIMNEFKMGNPANPNPQASASPEAAPAEQGERRISFVEFKSFCLYMYQAPLRELHKAICQQVPLQELQQSAIHIPQVPQGATPAGLATFFGTMLYCVHV